MLVAGVGLAAAWTKGQIDRIDRVEIDDTLLDTAGPPGEPINVLVVGVDDPARAADARTDSIVVAHLDPARDEVRILSVSRDLWVPIAGTPGRVNEARSLGGPDLLIATVEDALGIPIDHYAEIGFEGVIDLVDLAGGVEVSIGARMRDTYTGLDLASGCQRLDGMSTLALLRSRHLEYHDGSRWNSDTTGDLGRAARQRALARVVPATLVGLEGNPIDLVQFVDALGDHAAFDQALSDEDLLWWARWARDLDDDDLITLDVPTRGFRTETGASVLLIDDPDQQTQRFVSGENTDVAPSTDVGVVLLAEGPC